MKAAFFFPGIIYALIFYSQPNNCDKLNDGRYNVLFDTTFTKYQNFRLDIYENHFKKTFTTGDTVSGAIKWFDDCTFYLDPEIKINPDMLPLNERTWYYTCGLPYFQITLQQNDTIRFSLMCTPHLMSTFGFIVRQTD